MNHLLYEFSAVALILITLPGTIELTLLTVAAVLPGRHRRFDREKKANRELTGEDCLIKRLAVVVPARNEARTITRCIRSIAQCELPSALEMSIIVVADNCSDATAELASKLGARVIERFDSERRGKQFALDFAFTKLLKEGFDAFLVVDADSVVEVNLLKEVSSLLKLGADAVQARYLALNPEGSILGRLRNVALMAVNVLRPLGRDRLELSCGLTGNGFTLRRSTLESVAYDVHSHNDDHEYHTRLVLAGRRVVFADRTTVRGQMPARGADARAQRARWEGQRLRLIIQNVPKLARALIRGNLRVIEPLLELLLLPLAIHGLLLVCTAAVSFAPARRYAIFALALLASHATSAIIVAGGSVSDLVAVLAVPGYMAWKLILIPAIVRSARSDAEWIRTQR
jgi:cellulose synthase/poly-beta-1,6-N-acetylglucosamine synthase-like glycosyltransferase